MATQKQKDEVLKMTKDINKLKLTRTRLMNGSKSKIDLQKVIDKAEKRLKTKRTKYNI